jgi:riboflavin biosynthesis pyrimidine reductase
MNASPAIAPLRTLFELNRGRLLPLPPPLLRLYGKFRMPSASSGPYVFSNFVSTLDGVVSLHTKGHLGGGDISGFSIQDRMVMGLLRAVADVVIVGSGTLEADPRHVWTPEAICPELAQAYFGLRTALAKTGQALNVVVSASGNVDLRLPVFASGRVPVWIVTTPAGARRLGKQNPRDSITIRSIGRRGGSIAARAILDAVTRANPGGRILIEGGPRLLGCFYKERLVHEQFLTLAPQIAGRKTGDGRPGLVMGQTFAPGEPLWGTLVDARRGGNLLFLRYFFESVR